MGDFPFPFFAVDGGLIDDTLVLAEEQALLRRPVEALAVDSDSYLPIRSLVVLRRVGTLMLPAAGSRGREKYGP